MRGLLVALLILAACNGSGPVPRDLGDMAAPRDASAVAADLAGDDLAAVACRYCDAVLNPCPALGLTCNPMINCCVTVYP